MSADIVSDMEGPDYRCPNGSPHVWRDTQADYTTTEWEPSRTDAWTGFCLNCGHVRQFNQK